MVFVKKTFVLLEHSLMDLPVKSVQIIVMTVITYLHVINVLKDLKLKQKISKDNKLVFVLKYVVMEEDLKIHVMMEIMMMEMDVPQHVELKKDGHVLEAQVLSVVLVLN